MKKGTATVGYPISGIKLAEKMVIINGKHRERKNTNNSLSAIIEAKDSGTDFTSFFFRPPCFYFL